MRKAKLEDLFAARYNKRVEIKRVEYVYKMNLWNFSNEFQVSSTFI